MLEIVIHDVGHQLIHFAHLLPYLLQSILKKGLLISRTVLLGSLPFVFGAALVGRGQVASWASEAASHAATHTVSCRCRLVHSAKGEFYREYCENPRSTE